MSKQTHEIRDPIHVFIRIDSDERRVVDSTPIQRLRDIHQLSMTYLLYPSATHKRFEHSLGVMELAGRAFDVLTDPENLNDEIKDSLPDIVKRNVREYWRRALRLAALVHDVGHLPFLHSAEHLLLPEGHSHETITREIIESELMRSIWKKLTPPVRTSDIVKLAVGKQHASDLEFSLWETLLSEIITGDVFGVDRIDYLLRDSLHAGVAYGRFDHYRLVDTLRFLPHPATGAPALGVEEGGLHSAEALQIARYFMFAQVYLHPVRRAYDLLLQGFMSSWIEGANALETCEDVLKISDSDLLVALKHASESPDVAGHEFARRINERRHFRTLYEPTQHELELSLNASETVLKAAQDQFGELDVQLDPVRTSSSELDFPVLRRAGQIESAAALSEVIAQVPTTSFERVMISPEKRDDANRWLCENRDTLLSAVTAEGTDHG